MLEPTGGLPCRQECLLLYGAVNANFLQPDEEHISVSALKWRSTEW